MNNANNKQRGNKYITNISTNDILKDIIHFTEWLKLEPKEVASVDEVLELQKHSAELIHRVKNYVYTKPIEDQKNFDRLKKELYFLVSLSREKLNFSVNEEYEFNNLEVQLFYERLDSELIVLKTKYPKQLEELEQLISKISEPKRTKKNDKERLWFKTGIYVADGTANKLYKEGLSWAKVAEKLGFTKGHHNYFSQSISDTSTHNKNLYANKKKYMLLYDHFIENGLEMCSEFKEKVRNFTFN